MDFKEQIAAKLAKELKLDKKNVYNLLEVPADTTMGDYALPCFSFAKERKKAPAVIAQDLAGNVKTDNLIAAVKATGPYLNFFLEQSVWASNVLTAIEKGTLWDFGKGKEKIVIEYPSPNTNKPLHLGHVRNMVLATTVANMLAKDGNDIKQVNLNNDRGIHICKSMLAYQKWGKGKEPDKKSDHFVGEFYVLFEQKSKKDEKLLDEAHAMLKAWEDGDKEVRTLWKKMNTWALTGFKETYKKYDISFDKQYYESNIYEKGRALVEKNIKKFTKDETGAVIANLEKYKLPEKVLLRSDGTSIYMTQDLALTQEKEKDFKPDKQIWVVANEQDLHFKQLFAILDILGTKEAFHHLSYGMVELPDGKMKSREGRVVDADDLLDEMEKMAALQVKERHPDWSKKRVQEIASVLAMGAIRFFINKYDPAKNFVFDPEQSLSFEGDTGPYLQYTHARLCSILRKAGKLSKANLSLLTEPEAITVCKALFKLPDAFREGVEQLKPHHLAQQLLSVARAINTYYHTHPVLKAEDDMKAARLQLVDNARQAIAEGLTLLGIHAPEEM